MLEILFRIRRTKAKRVLGLHNVFVLLVFFWSLRLSCIIGSLCMCQEDVVSSAIVYEAPLLGAALRFNIDRNESVTVR